VLGLLVLPIGYMIWVSLHEWTIFDPSHPLIGISNYLGLLGDKWFLLALKVTLYYSAWASLAPVIAGLLLALLMNHPALRTRKMLRTLLILPWAVAPVITGIIWSWLFNGGYGLLNYILVQLGVTQSYIHFLSLPQYAIYTTIVAAYWVWTPLVFLLCYAGLQTIPGYLYEAATIDGATSAQQFHRITLPLVKNTLFVALTLLTMWNLREFPLIYAMTAGGPERATTVLGLLIYKTAFRDGDFGMASAMGVVLAAVTMVVSLAYFALMYRRVEY
jgi:ABC-type sugar transport system permease subunit